MAAGMIVGMIITIHDDDLVQNVLMDWYNGCSTKNKIQKKPTLKNLDARL
jgi:hypothetical protein